jgi:hypothetical protein
MPGLAGLLLLLLLLLFRVSLPRLLVFFLGLGGVWRAAEVSGLKFLYWNRAGAWPHVAFAGGERHVYIFLALLVCMHNVQPTRPALLIGDPFLPTKTPQWQILSLGVDAKHTTFPFKPKAPWTKHHSGI